MGGDVSLMRHGGAIEEALTPAERHRMHEAISDAQLSCASMPKITMPWNLPGLSMVLGDEEDSLVPRVPTVPGYVDPPASSESKDQAVLTVCTKATAFEHAIAFDSKRVCHLEDHDQLQLLIQKWEAMISIDYSAFDLGVDIIHLTYAERLDAVKDILGGKAIATLRQRLAQLSRYVKWSMEEARRPPFPVTTELVKNYIRHLRNDSATYSRLVGFQEAMKFAKHVVGLDCCLDAFESAWITGIFRTAGQPRPLRKQSTTLTVSALQFLEALIEDEQIGIVDRYATGVILIATHSRSRFGDLRKISEIFIDEAVGGDQDSLGYLEATSASHKMRATGNRLGAHLPLVAPLKGVGPKSWGKTFIKLAVKVGLPFQARRPMCPMLPAPNLMGDWTSRATTSGEIGKWILQLLIGSNFDSTGFTPHGCKATTLTMLAKYGADSDTRLILGHHQTRKGASEVYARDVQSAPLRVLESMFRDIRKGHFRPDETRSGMMVSQRDGALASTEVPLPVANSVPLDDGPQLGTEEASELPVNIGSDAGCDQSVAQSNSQADVDSDSDSSSSSSSSDSCLDEVVEDYAKNGAVQGEATNVASNQTKYKRELVYYQHRQSKVVHFLSFCGHSFLCGRQLTKEYRQCTLLLVVDSMKCQQCVRRHAGRSHDEDSARLGSAVKRARRE